MIDANYTTTAPARHDTMGDDDPVGLPTRAPRALRSPDMVTTVVQAHATPAVDTALGSVRENLLEVTYGVAGKVRDITPTVTALRTADRNALVSRLGDQELRLWMESAGQYTNPQDQQQLFDALAQGLDNTQLGRVIAALDGVGAITHDNAAIAGRFGDAIAANKPAAELQQFVQSAAGRIEHDQKTALIVAKALDALGSQAMPMPSTYSGGIPYAPSHPFELALAALSDAQLDSVVQAAVPETLEGSLRVVDPSSLVALLDRAATAPLNSQQKQRLVDAGMNAIQRLVPHPDEGPRPEVINAQLVGSLARLIGSEHGAGVEQRTGLFKTTANAWGRFAGGDAEVDAAIATALRDLLTTDSTGVMAELETRDREGAGVTRFVREMIAQGRAEELKPIVAQLQRGNDLKGDPIARFGSHDSANNHRHASVLGYFVGAVYAGVSQLNQSKQEGAATLSDVFSVASLLPGVGGPAFTAVKLLATEIVEQQIDDYKSGNTDLRHTIAQLAYPTASDGRRYEGSAAEAAYDSALGRVIDNNT
jgi:hypothetical protein